MSFTYNRYHSSFLPSLPTFLTPGNQKSFFHLHNFVISRMLNKCNFLRLAFFTHLNPLDIYLGCYTYQELILFCYWVTFHDMDVPWFHYFPAEIHLDCFQFLVMMNKRCCKHSCSSFYAIVKFSFLWDKCSRL